MPFISHQKLSESEGRVPFRNLLSFPYLGFSAISLRRESLDTVQVRPTWQERELQRKAEFISSSCESYIRTIPLCAVWQQRNDGCHLSYGLKEAVGKGIWILLEVCVDFPWW